MSMIAHFRLVDPSVANTLDAHDDEEMAQYLYPDGESSETTQDIDKSWDVIGHLLAAATEGALTTLLRGTEVGPDLGYGPALLMSPDLVRETASAMEPVDRSKLLSHYDPAALAKSEVYPDIWDDSRETQDYIGQNYEVVRSVFLEGARCNSALLVWLA